MKRMTAWSVIIALVLAVGSITTMGQSNPVPFDLNSGVYSFTTWNNTQAAGTYPPSMVFHMTPVIDQPLGTAQSADYNCAYNLTSGARVNGLGASGIQFINTGTLVCNCAFVGSAVMALNTTNRAQINVSFAAQQLPGAGQRVHGLRLEYRIGTTGTWLPVIQNGAPVELVTTVTSSTTATWPQQNFSAMLPTACENQALVQLRWFYYQVPAFSSGSRPPVRLDEIFISSNSNVGIATNVNVETISPSAPSQNTAFNVRVRATDALGAAKNVAAATPVTLSLNSGTGALSGTLTATIPAGQSFVDFTNVVYNTVEAGVSIRASAAGLTLGNSAPLTVQAPAAYALITGAQQDGYAGVAFNPITVRVHRADNNVDVNYGSTVSVVRVSGPGVLTGTASVSAIQGVVTFSDLSVSVPGTYQLQVNIPGLPSQTLPFTTAFAAPGMSTDIVPQFIQSRVASGTCNSSTQAFPIPVFARVTFTGLQPNTTYRYNTGLSQVQGGSTVGGGFNIHFNANTNTYVYGASKNLSTDGTFSTFSTLSTETSKSVWVNLVASTNGDFQEGNTIFWRVALGDNQGRMMRIYDLNQTSQVIRLGTATNQATGIVDNQSQLTPKNYVLLYDNTAGTGRPVSVAAIQSLGTAINGAEAFYASRQNSAGAWATFIPNTLPNGIRRIEERDFRTNAVVYAATSNDGIWNGVNTNPASYATPGGFSTPIVLETPRITVSTPTTGDTLCAGKAATTRFIARGVANVRIEFSRNNGLSWEDMGVVAAASGSATWTVPAIEFAGQCRVRVTGVERTDISATTLSFAVASEIIVTQSPASKNLCVGDQHSLIALTSGSVRAYQWFKNGTAIPGATSPLYRITDAQFSTSGFYHCRIWGFGTCGNAVTDTAHIRVARPTRIVNQTRNVPVGLGQTATLTVEAEIPDEATSYQWYKGQTMLVESRKYFGATSNRLEIRGVEASDIATDYYCVVEGVCGTATSRMVRVFTTGVYVEFATPAVNACAGQSATINGQAYANPATNNLVVRWWRNGSPLVDGGQYSGTTTATLVVANVTAADEGEYVLRAELADNPSQAAQESIDLVIASTPVITQQPQNVTVCAGQPISIGVDVAATGGVTYQWSKDGTILTGETAPMLTVASATIARGGAYRVRVQTSCGSIESDVATVTVRPATEITQQPPATVSVQVGQPLSITVAATGAGTVQYQWFKDGTQIAGEVAPTFAVASAANGDAGKYWARVRSECGDVLSDTSVVTVRPSVVSVDEDVIAGTTVGRISPNPSLGAAHLDLIVTTPASVVVRIVNAVGATVMTMAPGELASGNHRIALDASRFAAGTYTVITTVNGMAATQSFVVIK